MTDDRVAQIAKALPEAQQNMLLNTLRGMRGLRNYQDIAGDGAGAYSTARALVRKGLVRPFGFGGGEIGDLSEICATPLGLLVGEELRNLKRRKKR